MRYPEPVASAIKPEVFRVPFIGKKCFTVQLVQAEEEFQKLSETMENQEKSCLTQRDSGTSFNRK